LKRFDLNSNFFGGHTFKCLPFVAYLFLFIVSCKEPKLGSEILPEGDNTQLLRESDLMIESSTEREDSVRSDELSLNLLGAFNDPVLGKVRASVYCQLRPAVSNIDFGLGATADSIVLVFPYKSYYGSVSKLNGLQQFTAYRLREPFWKDSIYYSNDTLLRDASPLGQTPFIAPALLDSVPVGGTKEVPHLRIPLNIELAQEFLVNQASLANADVFTEFFNGVYISSETFLPTGGQGAILDFNLIGGARIDLFYHNDSNDSLKTSFIVNESSARFSRFNHRYADPVLQALNNAESGKQQLYLHTMAGLRAKIKLPDLMQWKGNRNILVHKALLTVTLDESSQGEYAPNPLLNIILKDASGTLLLTPDLLVGNTAYSGGEYNSSAKTYSFNLARYMQSRLNGLIEDEYFYIQPTGTGISSYRTILLGDKNQSGPFKFELLYQVVPGN
jgi:hypothetical protein